MSRRLRFHYCLQGSFPVLLRFGFTLDDFPSISFDGFLFDFRKRLGHTDIRMGFPLQLPPLQVSCMIALTMGCAHLFFFCSSVSFMTALACPTKLESTDFLKILHILKLNLTAGHFVNGGAGEDWSLYE